MFVKVKLLKGFPKPLLYEIPSEWRDRSLRGVVIQVPIKNNIFPAIVLETYDKVPQNVNFNIRKISSIEPFPNDPYYNDYIKKIAELFFLQPHYFYQRIKSFLIKKEKKESTQSLSFVNLSFDTLDQVRLTEDQSKVVNHVEKFIRQPEYHPTLLHGVTGSGKTEVYRELILANLKANKSTMFLLPEVALSIQFQHLFKTKFPLKTPVFGFHSATGEKEKKELWSCLLQGVPSLIIGVHLPPLLPIANLGLIIIDEEHELGFQEKKSPKLNSKNLAICRAHHYKIPILLGSATPSLSSLHNVKRRNWKFFQLKKRFQGKFPEIQKVFFDFKSKRKNFWVTKQLEEEINLCLAAKKQVLIFLNRRGYSFFVLCSQCGFVFECPDCSVSLTLHVSLQTEKAFLRCHYCNFKTDLPKFCTSCKATEDNLIKKGIGTQQVVLILKKMFPNAKIERADLDVTKRKIWGETLQDFESGKIDILVGTQTITKGYHFPNVNLVGILWADLGLHFPVFNASEVGLQKLVQVAGRAGRQSEKSKVVVQIMHDHNIFNYLTESDYLKFYEQEIKFREIVDYPPFCYLVQIELRNSEANQIDKEADALSNFLKRENIDKNLSLKILGPTRPTIFKVQKIEMRHIFVKTKTYKRIYNLLDRVCFENYKSKIFISVIF